MSPGSWARSLLIAVVVIVAIFVGLSMLVPVAEETRPTSLGSTGQPLRSSPEFVSPQTYNQLAQSSQYTPVSVLLRSGPEGIAYDAANGNLYVGLASGAVSVINSTNDSVTTPIHGYATVWSNAETYDATVRLLFLAGGIYGTNASLDVSVVEAINSSTNRIAAVQNFSAESPPPPVGPLDCLAAVGSNGTIFGCDFEYDRVDVFDGVTGKLVETIPVGTAPSGAVADPATGDVYVTNWGSANVSVIQESTEEVVGSFPVGSLPIGIALDTSNGYLYVASQGPQTVTVIDPTTDTVVATLDVGCHPQAIAYDPENQGIFVANYCGDDLTEISGVNDTFVQNLTVGFAPVGIAYDAANRGLYVANYMSLNVTAFFLHEYPVTFTEKGLPNGSSWSVQVGEWRESGSSPSFTVNEPNGSFEFGTSVVGNYWPVVRDAGQFQVAGSALDISVPYYLSVSLTFAVSGLPNDQYWRVNVTNTPLGLFYWQNWTETSDVFYVPVRATYAYSATFFGNDSAWDRSGEVVVGDVNVSITITIPVAGTPASSPAAWLFGLAAAIIVAVVVVAIVMVALRRRRKPAPPPPPATP